MRSQQQHRRDRSGAAVVETAVVLPLLLTLALGCTDFGRVFHAHTAVSNAARCGADYGARHNFSLQTRTAWEAAIRSAVEAEMRSLRQFDSNALVVEIETTTDADSLFRVAVRASYPFATSVAWPGVPSSVTLIHRVEMRRIH